MAELTGMRKVTISLPADLLREVREMVSAGLFPSQNAAVRAALQKEVYRAREAWLRREFEEAARDPLFLRDVDETTRAFETADAETARLLPDG
jgi:Arc/MetJ-type ribon-helix-helix transcriptional regulator